MTARNEGLFDVGYRNAMFEVRSAVEILGVLREWRTIELLQRLLKLFTALLMNVNLRLHRPVHSSAHFRFFVDLAMLMGVGPFKLI